MKTINVLGSRVVESIEENIYELEIPDSLSEEETELFILKNIDKLKLVRTQTKKNASEGEIHVKQILGGGCFNPAEEGKKSVPEATNKFVDTSKIKEGLNQLIIKEELKRFMERFPKDMDSLRHTDIYLLLHNSLNSRQIEFAVFILDKAHELIKEEHLFKILEGVGVVDSPSLIWKYIELGYDGLNINGRNLKDIYKSRGVEWRTTF